MNHAERHARRWALASAIALALLSPRAYAEAPRAESAVPRLDDGARFEDDATTATAQVDTDDRRPWLGLVLDAGVPDGANIGIVGRPLSWLRLHAGGSYNLISGGIRGGVAYVPFDYWVVPTLVVEGGHYFAGSAKDALETVAGLEVDFAPERVEYTYANAHLGLEFGGDWYTIFLRGGYSFVNATLRPPSDDEVRFEDDVRMSAWLPSAKLGLIVYLY